MFLRSARNAEFAVPQKFIDEAMSFVHRCWVDQDGLFHYTAQGPQSTAVTRGLMGSAVVSLALAGQHDSPQALAAGDWLLAHPFQYYGQTISAGRGADRFFYSTYYCSQAAAQLGGRYWKGIFPPIAELMVRAQQADGSFPGRNVWAACAAGLPVRLRLHHRAGRALAHSGLSTFAGLSKVDMKIKTLCHALASTLLLVMGGAAAAARLRLARRPPRLWRRR